MKKTFLTLVLVFATLTTLGCSQAQQRAVQGTIIGGVAGGVIGHQEGERDKGAAIGAAAGGIAGYLYGKTEDQAQTIEQQNDKIRQGGHWETRTQTYWDSQHGVWRTAEVQVWVPGPPKK